MSFSSYLLFWVTLQIYIFFIIWKLFGRNFYFQKIIEITTLACIVILSLYLSYTLVIP